MIRDKMKYSEKISNKLNELLERTYDAEKGYKLAQEKVESSKIKSFLVDKVNQRHDFAHELKSEILEYGKLPDKGGSLKGDLHRTWMNLTTTITNNSEERILEEVVRGENASEEEYNEILNNTDMTLPESTKNLLFKQRDAIEAALNKAEFLEEVVS